jgi:hypothetical protein
MVLSWCEREVLAGGSQVLICRRHTGEQPISVVQGPIGLSCLAR